MKESWVADKSWSERAVRRFRVPLGFLFAVAFLVWARPDATTLTLSLLLVLPGLWLRAYAAGYVRKNAELTTTGPYAYTRNPLYLGSLVAALGFVGAARNGWLAAAFLVLFFAIYLPVILSEEVWLRNHFGSFAEYSRRVPRLVPSLRTALRAQTSSPAAAFSWERYRKHREYNSSIGAAALYAVLIALLLLRQHGFIPGH